MHTVELLQQAVELARQAGYTIRQEWLGGSNGGACTVKGRKHLFLDLAQAPLEQLDQVIAALKADAAVQELPIPEALRALLPLRRTA